MTRRPALHDRTSITVIREWGDPINSNQSLRMTLYWHARRWKFPAQRMYQPPLYERSPRRLHAGIAVNDQRRVVNGPFRRWEHECSLRFEEEMAEITATIKREEEAALRLYDIATGKTRPPEETQ